MGQQQEGDVVLSHPRFKCTGVLIKCRMLAVYRREVQVYWCIDKMQDVSCVSERGSGRVGTINTCQGNWFGRTDTPSSQAVTGLNVFTGKNC
jgi:hypothetical protein